MGEYKRPEALPPGAVPEDELTEEQRTVLAFLRGHNRQLLEAFGRALEAIGMKDAAGAAFHIVGYQVAEGPKNPDPNLCCMCCCDGTFCCVGQTCEGCCPNPCPLPP
jgi:hypothetical protein